MAEEKRLGRGLESLIGREKLEEDVFAATQPTGEIEMEKIRPNPLQPRQDISEENLAELVESIRTRGLLQPIVVRPAGSVYELIAGERRWQAAKRLGMRTISAVVREVGDEDMLTLALIENLQRVDLNPIEKARAFAGLMSRFSLTQEDAAKRIGKDRTTIANFVRLLDLPKEVRDHVSRGTISMGHARALLAIANELQQIQLCNRIILEGLSVRAVEIAARRGTRRPDSKQPKDPDLKAIEDRLRELLSVKVEIVKRGKRGRIVIHFADNDDFDRIMEKMKA